MDWCGSKKLTSLACASHPDMALAERKQFVSLLGEDQAVLPKVRSSTRTTEAGKAPLAMENHVGSSYGHRLRNRSVR